MQTGGPVHRSGCEELDLTESALRNRVKQYDVDRGAERRLPGAGLIHHSDRGVQYAAESYQDVLDEHGIICSMSRRGDCWDNAVTESFFGTLKTELVYRRPWPTRRDAKNAIADYIEAFYNPYRLHSALSYLSPMAFERFRALNSANAT